MNLAKVLQSFVVEQLCTRQKQHGQQLPRLHKGNSVNVRQVIRFVVRCSVALEVEGLFGAGFDFNSLSSTRYRDRLWQIRAGDVDLRIPKLRTGATFWACWNRTQERVFAWDEWFEPVFREY
ncbi:hypothetical protein D9M73_264440 [compost metagenome]